VVKASPELESLRQEVTKSLFDVHVINPENLFAKVDHKPTHGSVGNARFNPDDSGGNQAENSPDLDVATKTEKSEPEQPHTSVARSDDSFSFPAQPVLQRSDAEISALDTTQAVVKGAIETHSGSAESEDAGSNLEDDDGEPPYFDMMALDGPDETEVEKRPRALTIEAGSVLTHCHFSASDYTDVSIGASTQSIHLALMARIKTTVSTSEEVKDTSLVPLPNSTTQELASGSVG